MTVPVKFCYPNFKASTASASFFIMERLRFKGKQTAIRLNVDSAHERTAFPVQGLTRGQAELLQECIQTRLGIKPSIGTGPVPTRGRNMGGKFK